MRNDLLADIVTASGGTITDRNNRNLLLKDWLNAVQAPAVNYVARLNGADQYWQLSEAISYTTGDVINISCSQPRAFFDTLLSSADIALLVRRSSNGNVIFNGCTVSVNGVGISSNTTPWPDGVSDFEITLTSEVNLLFFGLRGDNLTSYFQGFIYGFSDSLGNEIPLTNKAQGATQLATVGNVNATMVGYNEDVWEQV